MEMFLLVYLVFFVSGMLISLVGRRIEKSLLRF
jgi:ABC-type amino acid transport system permease subunit